MAATDDVSPEPVDVLLVVDDDVLDRLGVLVRHLCVGLMDEAVRVRVLARSRRAFADDRIGPAPVALFPRHRWPWARPSADEVLKMLGGQRPRLVHCFSAKLGRWMLFWAQQWKATVAVHLTDAEDLGDFTRGRAAGSTFGIAITPGVRDALVEKRPELEPFVDIVAPGIPAQSEPACLKNPERIPAVVVTTPLTHDCGVDGLLTAWKEVVSSGQESQLFILSTGRGEPRFRRQTEQLGLRSHVTFAWDMRDWTTLGEAMRGADLYVVPGRRRRFSMATLTAMASGLAVVAPTGTMEDYLIDGETARLFDPTRPKDLAAVLTALLEDRSSARDLAHGALDYVRTHHQASAMVTATARRYRELAQMQPA